jgi:uncharacterized membrane protein YgaE (UPF0421/DUF939 family)
MGGKQVTQRPEQQRTAGAQVRQSAHAGRERVAASGLMIAQTAGAAALAWLVTAALIGHHPGFAPIGAVIAVEVTRGQRARHAVELVLGVALGVGVAALLGSAVGNPPLRIGLVVALAMALALLVSGSPVLVVQASLAAIFVAATSSPTVGLAGQHLIESLIGGGVALIVTQLLFPLNPVQLVNAAALPVFSQLSNALKETAAALADGDRDRAEQALEQVRAIDPLVRRLYEALEVGQQVARLAPLRRRLRRQLDPYIDATRQVDYAVRNTRVLARSAVGLLQAGRPAPAALVASVRELADAVRMLGGELVAREPHKAAQLAGMRAAAQAKAVLEERCEPAVAMVVGQVQSTVFDLLRGSGMDPTVAQQALDEPISTSTRPRGWGVTDKDA